MADATPDTRHYLIRAHTKGGHVHAHVWSGTPLQTGQANRPKLGTLVMDPDEWVVFRDRFLRVQGGTLCTPDGHTMEVDDRTT